MSYKKISSEFVPLTPELAKRFATMTPVPGERRIKSARLKNHENRLQQGHFGSPTWARLIVTNNDRNEWRLDGQHTSNVLANCVPDLFPRDEHVTIHTYEVTSLETDMADLFELFDSPVAARSNEDKMNMYASQFPDLAGFHPGFLVKVANGVDYFFRDMKNTTLPFSKLFVSREHGMYFDHEINRKFALWLHQWHESLNAWMIGKPGLAAEMFSDWKLNPSLAESFWNFVLNESHPDPDNETRELARQLKDWNSKKPIIGQDRFRLRAQKEWNRYRRFFNDSGSTGIVLPPQSIPGQPGTELPL